ncbi:MAG: hypothetical protein ACK5MZ_09900 [Aestuariibaculum sp.]
MKIVVGLLLIFLSSCQQKQESKNFDNNSKSIQSDNLFILKVNISENLIKIIPPKNSNFELLDNSTKIEPFKYGDFNADGKEDILVFLGACGTGGCIYALFLNQYDNFYTLAFMDYLKNAEFRIEKNGLWTIKSSEELEPYNPFKLQISIFKFNKEKYEYKMDTTFVYHDKEGEKMNH